MSDAPPEGCEICGEGPVEVVLYPVAVHFKGSGFYTTDYGRGSRKKDVSRDGDSAASDAGVETKPKPETTADGKPKPETTKAES